MAGYRIWNKRIRLEVYPLSYASQLKIVANCCSYFHAETNLYFQSFKRQYWNWRARCWVVLTFTYVKFHKVNTQLEVNLKHICLINNRICLFIYFIILRQILMKFAVLIPIRTTVFLLILMIPIINCSLLLCRMLIQPIICFTFLKAMGCLFCKETLLERISSVDNLFCKQSLLQTISSVDNLFCRQSIL